MLFSSLTFWKRPAIPLLLAFTAGIFWARFWPLSVVWILLVSLIGFALLALSLFLSRSLFFSCFLPLLCFVAVGHLTGLQVHGPEREALRLTAFAMDDTVEVTGRIHGLPRPRHGRTQSHLTEVEVRRDSGEKILLNGKLMFTLVGEAEMPLPGSLVRLKGKIRPFNNFENPGGFDYRRFQHGRGIMGRIWCRDRDLKILETEADAFISGVDRFRLFLGEKIRSNVQDIDAGAVLSAMLIGDRGHVTPALREAYTKSGIAHLMAISGLHVGLLAGGVFWLTERLLRWFRFFTERGLTRRVAAFPALAMALSYAMISGGAPSALRAVVMVACGLFVLVMHRSTDVWSLLVLAAGLLLAADPERLVNVGFLLSVTAVAGLILGFQRYPQSFRDAKGFRAKALLWLKGLFKTSLFAALFTAPICLYVFREVSLIGIAVNFVMVPLMGMLTLPLAMAGLFLSLFFRGGELLLQLAGVLTSWGNGLAGFTGSLPFAVLRPGALTLLEVFIFFGFLLLWLGFDSKKGWQKPRVVLALFLILLLSGDILRWTLSRMGPSRPLVTMLDVGQGSAAGIRLPGGGVMLVDGGGFPWPDSMDTGRIILSPWLDFQKIRTIDVLVASHPHGDHIKGFFYLAERYRVKELWIAEAAMEERMGQELVAAFRERGTRIRHPSMEKKPIEIKGTMFEFFGPGELRFSSVNDDSLVFRMQTPHGSMMFTGDAERRAENHYAQTHGEALASDVLLVGHHGSRTSTQAPFLKAVNPSLALISCGVRNRYRYPSVEVLRRLEAAGVKVFRTDTGGAVTLDFKENGIGAGYTPIGRWDRLW
ncbi:competence protein ComEC [Desulfobotulus alkaliphilus]|uniref:Competence protein ComEC n=1 Tax=Desulfobotulus alkaliphilus TaxID=622671 RepID=A0A562RS90_9BACT|nr:DNA internalization-related competence protein ComEC/Rec2 [Desulfobotulus alkaliphilus]TWI71240.1 competence protein ComEC [Desulfobotulus alkaliphilus]